MAIEDSYTSQYGVDFDDMPVSGPDDFTLSEKRRALFEAESQLELDVNNNEQIKQDDLTNAHTSAILNYATFKLTSQAESPSDVTLGDLVDGGDQIDQYSQQFLDSYKNIVDDIRESGGGRHGNSTISANRGDKSGTY